MVAGFEAPFDTLGYINPENGYIELYSGERFGSAARAEELFHFRQLKARGLLGTAEENIPSLSSRRWRGKWRPCCGAPVFNPRGNHGYTEPTSRSCA